MTAISFKTTRLQTTPFHVRTSAANRLMRWHSWKGYQVSDSYFDAELEYFACRNACGVFDLSPMSKYRIVGSDAQAFMNRLVTRDIDKLRVGRVAYVVWCNDAGKVLDDGTLFRFDDDDYRLCAYGRHFDWLLTSAIGFDVTVEEETDLVAALAVQGPTSCAVLGAMGLGNIDQLRPFEIRHYEFAGGELSVSRTGFTGDLGYELWITPTLALTLWDSLFEAGAPHGVRPMGTDALEMARIEAGFLQAEHDFLPADLVVRPGRARSPYELGLGWLVANDKPLFNGRLALRREQAEQSARWQCLKLDIEGNKPAHAAFLYQGKKQVGFVTSAMWSPVAKKNIAIASVSATVDPVRQPLTADIYYQKELHWSRAQMPCSVVTEPFWNPPRRRQTPAGSY